MQVRVNELAELRVAQQFGLPLTPARATGDFDKLVSWQCESTDPSGPFDGFIQHHVERLFVLNGEILGSRVVPAMRAPQRTVDRGKALLRFIEDTGTWSALEALPYFLSVAQLRGEIESVLRRNLVSPEPQRAGRAALALTLWGQLRKRKRAPTLPHRVIESLLTAVESGQERGMPMRLRAARALFVDEFITVAEAKRLVGALKDLATIADYKNVPLDSHAAVAVSLIRAECVRLSEALRVRGIVDPILATWLDAIQNDPLPEVRYALCEAT